MEGLMHLLRPLVLTLRDVLPIVAVILGFQLFVIRKPIANLRKVTIGLAYVVVGLSLFMVGLDKALFPLGRIMAEQLTDPAFLASQAIVDQPLHWTNFYWVYCFAFLIGFSTTIAEPSLMAVAIKANAVSGGSIGIWGLRIAVALGVAIGIALGSYRIVAGHPIHYYIIAGYLVVIVQTRFAPKLIVPLAYDSGGVTTSTVTVPLVAALGLGLSEAVPGRDPLIDGFGLIAFASVFPIMSVLGYAQLAGIRKGQATTTSKARHEVEAPSG
jgi:hypothetical protein